MRALRLAARLALAAALLWAAAVAALLLFAPRLIYPFDPAPAEPGALPGAVAVTFPAADGTELSAWLAPPAAEGGPVLLYFMGNAGNLGRSVPGLREMLAAGYGLAALEYRGGAGRPGAPGEAALIADALALYDALDRLAGRPVPAARRVIWGTSLGSGLAVALAAEREAAALVLETPFDRLCAVAEHRFPLVPACTLMPTDRWDSAARAARLRLPVLILHGTADAIVPPERSAALLDVLPGPARRILYEGGNHNDLRLFGAGRDAIAWLRSIGN